QAVLSRDGTRIAVISSVASSGDPKRRHEDVVQLYNTASGRPVSPRLEGPEIDGANVDVSPDNRLLVVGGWGEPHRSAHRLRPWADGRQISLDGWGTARVWDLQTAMPLSGSKSMNHGYCVYRAYFSPDGQRILTCSANETARL